VRLGFVLMLLFLGVNVFFVYQAIALDIALSRDIMGWLERAGAATTCEDMAEYIEKALEGMDKWGMYEGSWEWLYIHPGNDIAISRELLKSLADRAREIEKTYSRGSMDYAESMEEIKRTFARIAVNPWAWYTLRYMPWLYYWGWILAVWTVLGIYALVDEKDFRCKFGRHEDFYGRCSRCGVPIKRRKTKNEREGCVENDV